MMNNLQLEAMIVIIFWRRGSSIMMGLMWLHLCGKQLKILHLILC